MTDTYTSRDFVILMQGAELSANPEWVPGQVVLAAADELGRFSALTGQLLQVPKAEVDAKRAKSLQRLADRSTSEDGLDWKALRRRKS